MQPSQYDMFLNHSPFSVGLDISERALRLVQLKKTGNKIRLLSLSRTPLEAGLIKDGKFSDAKIGVEKVKSLLHELKGNPMASFSCTACLPEPKTFIKVIDLPSLPGKNIESEIIEEAKKHIPYPLEQSYLDWQYIHPQDHSKAIIGLAPKEVVENYQEVLNQAGFSPEALEIEAAAICRAITPLNKKLDEPIMIVDLGATRTGLIIYENDYIPFSLSLKISSNALTDLLATELKLKPEQAEKAKNKIGLDPQRAEGGVLKILQAPLEELCQEIREAKYFYYEHFAQKNTVKKIILTGGGANLKGLSAFIKNLTKLEVEKANPLLNLTLGKMEIEEEQSHSFTTAIGLALRKFQN